MKTYVVTLPVVTSVNVAVEAEGEEAAISKAQMLDLRFDVTGEGDPEIGEEVAMPRAVVQGNVYHGPINEAYAEVEP